MCKKVLQKSFQVGGTYIISLFVKKTLATSMYKNTGQNTKKFTEKKQENFFCIFFCKFFCIFSILKYKAQTTV